MTNTVNIAQLKGTRCTRCRTGKGARAQDVAVSLKVSARKTASLCQAGADSHRAHKAHGSSCATVAQLTLAPMQPPPEVKHAHGPSKQHLHARSGQFKRREVCVSGGAAHFAYVAGESAVPKQASRAHHLSTLAQQLKR